MYELFNNTVCVPSAFLFENGIVNMDHYNKLCQRKHLTRIGPRGGNGRTSRIEVSSMRKDIKFKVVEILGDPDANAKNITFTDFVLTDQQAVEFFNHHTLDNNEPLPEPKIKEYSANAAVLNAITTIMATAMGKRKALGSKVKPWEKLAIVVSEIPKHKWPHSLPSNHRSLQRKYNDYRANGYESLIHKLFSQKNAEKINDDAKSYVLARWSDRVRKCANYAQLLSEYNSMAIDQNWKQLKSEQSLMNFLQDPKIEPLWYGHRFGELKSKEKFNYQHSTIISSMRDSLWYSDGTKLNYYYQDENGKMQTVQVYEVFDTYSEVFLGYHISNTENYEAQYYAFKMALQIAGHKPFEIKFDNQGGTKKLQANSFLGKLARLTSNTQPYNGKSKTIESAFGRFQSQFLKQDWFFSGQNITATKLESKANMEMILANASSLPSLQEIKEVYRKRREEWNAAPHPKTGVSRLEMYLSSQNPATPEVSIWDMIDMFWITREKQVTCNAYGISFTDNKVDYSFMVYDENRNPDVRWLRDNIDKKFTIKYDPDDMSLIQLYEKTPLGLKKAATAETKIEIHRNRQEQEDWEASYYTQINNSLKVLRQEDRDFTDNNLTKHGMHPENYGLVAPVLKGIESSRKQKGKTEKNDIGSYQKIESNAVLAGIENDTDIFNKY